MYKLIDKLHQEISSLDDGDVFKSKSVVFEDIISVCVDIVKEAGYKVVKKPEDDYDHVDGPIGLLNFFNGLLQYKHPDFMVSNSNMKKNRSIIRSFINSRKEASNINEKEAIKECAEIIYTIFQHEDEFNFENPINIGLLGQANLGWVTERALSIINTKVMKEEEKKRDKLIASFEEIYEKEKISFGDLDKILSSLKEDSYGK